MAHAHTHIYTYKQYKTVANIWMRTTTQHRESKKLFVLLFTVFVIPLWKQDFQTYR